MSPPGSLTDAQGTIPPRLRWRSFHDQPEATKGLSLKLKRYRSHVLRQACPTHLPAQGLTLKEVGDHLGHMSVAAPRIYAKVDLVGLREVAALDVRPLVDCLQQSEQSAAPFPHSSGRTSCTPLSARIM